MRTRYRNVAFLAELMINILVFSISCAVLVGLFGKAYQISNQTRLETTASVEVRNLVEVIKAQGPEGLEYAQARDDGTLYCYYDEDWQPLAPPFEDRSSVAYTVELMMAPEDMAGGVLYHIKAVALGGGESGQEIYSLTTSTYTPDFAAG